MWNYQVNLLNQGDYVTLYGKIQNCFWKKIVFESSRKPVFFFTTLSPILSEILPLLYSHHFSLLVSSIHILLLSELTEKKIKVAEIMLNDFYRMLPELYGNKSCTLNALLIIHLCHYVRVWGPLWTHTLFGFENFQWSYHQHNAFKKKIGWTASIFYCNFLSNHWKYSRYISRKRRWSYSVLLRTTFHFSAERTWHWYLQVFIQLESSSHAVMKLVHYKNWTWL